jgi:hypothetical protein
MSLLLALLDSGDAFATGSLSTVTLSSLTGDAIGGAAASGVFGANITAFALSGAAAGGAEATGALPGVVVTPLSGAAAGGELEVTRRALSARYRLAVSVAEKRRQKLRIEEIAEEVAEPVTAEPVAIPPYIAPPPRKVAEPELARMYLATTPREESVVITIAQSPLGEAADLIVAEENTRRIRLREDDDLLLMAA